MNPIDQWATDKAMRAIAFALTGRRLRTEASGIEHVPAQGPALLVARHYHHLFDGLAFFAALPRRFHIVVTMDWVRGSMTKFFMYSLNRLARWPMVLRADALARIEPHERLFTAADIRRYQAGALRDAVALLHEGRLLVVFPEAYPNIDPGYTAKKTDDEFLPFKPGFLHMVSAAERRHSIKIPMIPVGIHYRAEKPTVAMLRFGAPLYLHDNATRERQIAILEQKVKELSGVPASAALA